MIHPVGVGLSSWFWTPLMESFDKSSNPPMYAPDLIGCGLDHGADPWDPETAGLFFPLSWVEGVETLLNEVVLLKMSKDEAGYNSEAGCLVIVQGGL
ncbi:MAG: hypothetical protein SGBAC_008381, partial [Bacillariaceae sp.]